MRWSNDMPGEPETEHSEEAVLSYRFPEVAEKHEILLARSDQVDTTEQNVAPGLKPLFKPRSGVTLNVDASIRDEVYTVWGREPRPEQKLIEEVGVTQEILQQKLEEMYQRGLEQGRLEGRSTLEQEVREKAVKSGHEAGFQQGMEQGRQSGLEEGRQDISKQLKNIEQLQSAMKDSARLLSERQIEEVAELIERLLIEVVAGELKLAPEHIQSLVKNAVDLLNGDGSGHVRVYVHPDDLKWLEPLQHDEKVPLSFRADDQLTRGGCRVEADQGEVYATLESRLSDCIEQFRNNLMDRPERQEPPDFSPLYEADSHSETDSEQQFASTPAESAAEASGSSDSAAPSSQQSAADSFKATEKSLDSAETVESFQFQPQSGAGESLGAWGGLGQ